MYELRRSPLHGVGVFATRRIPKGEHIPMNCQLVAYRDEFTNGMPTTGVIYGTRVYVPLGGYPLWATNYSDQPNLSVTRWGVEANRDISSGEELLVKQA